MVLCAICNYWQHGLCFCIKDEQEAPEHHVCDVCANVSMKISLMEGGILSENQVFLEIF